MSAFGKGVTVAMAVAAAAAGSMQPKQEPPPVRTEEEEIAIEYGSDGNPIQGQL